MLTENDRKGPERIESSMEFPELAKLNFSELSWIQEDDISETHRTEIDDRVEVFLNHSYKKDWVIDGYLDQKIELGDGITARLLGKSVSIPDQNDGSKKDISYNFALVHQDSTLYFQLHVDVSPSTELAQAGAYVRKKDPSHLLPKGAGIDCYAKLLDILPSTANTLRKPIRHYAFNMGDDFEGWSKIFGPVFKNSPTEYTKDHSGYAGIYRPAQ
jgi:hypothetical protein